MIRQMLLHTIFFTDTLTIIIPVIFPHITKLPVGSPAYCLPEDLNDKRLIEQWSSQLSL